MSHCKVLVVKVSGRFSDLLVERASASILDGYDAGVHSTLILSFTM